MGTVDGYPVGGPGGSTDCRRDRGGARHHGLQDPLVRGTAVADPERHAGAAALLLHDPGRHLHRHRPQGGHDRHHHLRLPGDGAADPSGVEGGVAGGARGRHHGRLHQAPDAVEGRTAGGAADPDGRRQSGHHAVSGDGRPRILRRRQGAGARSPEPAAFAVDRPRRWRSAW